MNALGGKSVNDYCVGTVHIQRTTGPRQMSRRRRFTNTKTNTAKENHTKIRATEIPRQGRWVGPTNAQPTGAAKTERVLSAHLCFKQKV